MGISNSFLILLFFIFLLNKSNTILCQEDGERELIDAYVEEIFKSGNNIPGLGLGVIKEGQIFLNKGYGFKNLDLQQNVTQDTLFSIASISKSFGAIILAKALNEKFPDLGESVLDVPIQRLLPEDEQIILSDRYRSQTITFRDLLAHKTCLSPSLLGVFFGYFQNKELEQFVRTKYIREVCPFRIVPIYNNDMFELAGFYLNKIIGRNYTELLQEFLDDLEMSSTILIKLGENYDNMDNLSKGYFPTGDNQRSLWHMNLLRRLANSPFSGGLLSPTTDMLKYLLFHLNRGEVNGKSVVKPEILKWISTPSSTHPTSVFENMDNPDYTFYRDFYFGVGIDVGIYKGMELISQNGIFSPFQSRISIIPALKIGIFSVTNGPGNLNDDNTHRILHKKIIEVLTGEETSKDSLLKLNDSHKTREKLPKLSKIIAKADSKKRNKIRNEDLIGDYQNDRQGFLNIHPDEDGDLALDYGLYGIGKLILDEASNVYKLEMSEIMTGDFLTMFNPVPELSIVFSQDSSYLLLTFNGETVKFERDLQLPEKLWPDDSCAPPPLFPLT